MIVLCRQHLTEESQGSNLVQVVTDIAGLHATGATTPYLPRWRYDILRALDYFQSGEAPFDERMNDALEIVIQRRKEGLWLLQAKYPGREFLELEKVGEPSRWNTLRALRVLKRYAHFAANYHNRADPGVLVRTLGKPKPLTKRWADQPCR